MTSDQKIAAFILLAFAVGAPIWWFASKETPEQIEARLEKEDARANGRKAEEISVRALQTCQSALRGISRDPATAKIPDVGPMRDGADHRFLWDGTHMVRMRNGLGMEIAVTAFCVVNESDGQIKLLTLDGKQIISPRGA